MLYQIADHENWFLNKVNRQYECKGGKLLKYPETGAGSPSAQWLLRIH